MKWLHLLLAITHKFTLNIPYSNEKQRKDVRKKKPLLALREAVGGRPGLQNKARKTKI